MNLALIGRGIEHSQSPLLYKELIGSHINYDLLDFDSTEMIPSLIELSRKYVGLNITTPYKKFYLPEVTILDDDSKNIGAINTIKFNHDLFLATNTDFIAVRKIMRSYIKEFIDVRIVLLGDGVMARLTQLIASDLGVTVFQYARKSHGDIEKLDLSEKTSCQTIIINSCNRDFIFLGSLNKDHIFWDYNYNFPAHSIRIPALVKSYQDGQQMLRLQAEAAVEFWSSN